MPITGKELVLKNLAKWGGGFVDHVNDTMANVAGMMDDRATLNMSLRDHSLDDLRKMGHPYSLRNRVSIHTPDYQVHEQSGNLLQSKSSGIDPASIDGGVLRATAWTKIDEEMAPYAAYLIYGTSKMVPRSVLWGSLGEVSGDIKTYISDNLRNAKVSL